MKDYQKNLENAGEIPEKIQENTVWTYCEFLDKYLEIFLKTNIKLENFWKNSYGKLKFND